MQIFDPPPPARQVPSRPRLPRIPRISAPAFVRRPLTWVIAAEALVTCGFLVAALHLLSASLPAVPPASMALPATAAPSLAPPAVAGLLPGGAPASPAPRPGLGAGVGFLGGLLAGLNSDQASFEQAEWAALQALSGAIRTYIEGVMLPAVERAAHGAAGASRSP